MVSTMFALSVADRMGTVFARMNTETRAHHAAADESWLALLRSDLRKADYVHQLARVYGFEAPLESACAYTPGLASVIEPRQLTKSGLIAQDLLALGLKPTDLAELSQCLAIMPFQTTAEALAWMYVIERANLLREAVRRHLI